MPEYGVCKSRETSVTCSRPRHSARRRRSASSTNRCEWPPPISNRRLGGFTGSHSHWSEKKMSPYQARASRPLLSPSVMIATASICSMPSPNAACQSARTLRLCVTHWPAPVSPLSCRDHARIGGERIGPDLAERLATGPDVIQRPRRQAEYAALRHHIHAHREIVAALGVLIQPGIRLVDLPGPVEVRRLAQIDLDFLDAPDAAPWVAAPSTVLPSCASSVS